MSRAVPSTRIPALDGIRAAAVLIVVASHVQRFLQPLPLVAVDTAENIAVAAVSLFFVLSGYLIGDLLFAEWSGTGTVRPKEFWARRALRTWPLYFIALAVNRIFVPGHPPAPSLLAFVTFTQSLFDMNYFIESWSLSVEELFYLIAPIVLWCSLRLFGRRGIFAGIAIVIGAAVLIRARVGYQLHPATTFDTLFLGVLLAGMFRFYPKACAALRSQSALIFVTGALAVALMIWWGRPLEFRQYQFVIGLGCAMMLCAALDPLMPISRVLGLTWWRPIALSSYSTYLAHMFVIRGVTSLELKNATAGATYDWPLFVIAVAAALTVGWVIHVTIERPALRLRERLVPRRGDPSPREIWDTLHGSQCIGQNT